MACQGIRPSSALNLDRFRWKNNNLQYFRVRGFLLKLHSLLLQWHVDGLKEDIVVSSWGTARLLPLGREQKLKFAFNHLAKLVLLTVPSTSLFRSIPETLSIHQGLQQIHWSGPQKAGSLSYLRQLMAGSRTQIHPRWLMVQPQQMLSGTQSFCSKFLTANRD